jgi:hypothetical protein
MPAATARRSGFIATADERVDSQSTCPSAIFSFDSGRMEISQFERVTLRAEDSPMKE